MSEWDKNRHVPIEELEGREEFVRDNAMALLRQRDERIREQKSALSQCNKARRDIEKEIAILRVEVKKWRDEADGYHQKLCIEIERVKGLNTEVDHLRSYMNEEAFTLLAHIRNLKAERDEALAREAAQAGLISSLQQERKDWWIERDDLLAQVAVLLQRLREEHCQSESCDLHIEPYAKARALLDRLQRAEAAVEAARCFAKAFATLQEAITNAFYIQQIHGMPYMGKTYGEEWKALQEALAVWEDKQ